MTSIAARFSILALVLFAALPARSEALYSDGPI